MDPIRQRTEDQKRSFYRLIFNLCRKNIGSMIDSQSTQVQRTCADMASYLGISDYEVFSRAYIWYYGSRCADIRSDFASYLLSGCDDVPVYVKQFTREWQPGLLAA